MKRLLCLSVGLALCSMASAANAATVDFMPIVQPAVEVVGTVVAALAVPMAWYAVKLITAKLHLAGLAKDEAMRAVVDQGLKKAIGFGLSKVQTMVKQAPLKVDVKSAIVAEAANYAIEHVPEALDHFGVGPDELGTKLAAMIEARLGMEAVDAVPGSVGAAIASPNATG